MRSGSKTAFSYFTLSHWQLNAITRVVQCKTVHFSVCACHPCMGVSLDMFDTPPQNYAENLRHDFELVLAPGYVFHIAATC